MGNSLLDILKRQGGGHRRQDPRPLPWLRHPTSRRAAHPPYPSATIRSSCMISFVQASVNPNNFDFDATPISTPTSTTSSISSTPSMSIAALSFLNDNNYHGGFETGGGGESVEAMEANYEAWVKGFVRDGGRGGHAAAPDPIQNMRPDITLFVSKTLFNSDLRGRRRGRVGADFGCYVPEKRIWRPEHGEMLPTEGHLPHLSAPALLAAALKELALSRS
ncbi:putative strigolactone esterase DAD2 [Cinnamomum micranthum f. kanehirae]|uniref:Putative strigolactone esterase DAD2 n=1 Tax=Cinnamomum micranthum f. kanehirae TaxID=337451 RepID=A0A443N5W0_9MAGN|nr:putative strigolactone esterase DAD2 [Cinnamomum micranthum f. kanehirae]